MRGAVAEECEVVSRVFRSSKVFVDDKLINQD